jgi:hypothetical protein
MGSKVILIMVLISCSEYTILRVPFKMPVI